MARSLKNSVLSDSEFWDELYWMHLEIQRETYKHACETFGLPYKHRTLQEIHDARIAKERRSLNKSAKKKAPRE